MTKSKAARHAYAPRRNISPYLHYQNAMRESFKAQNPGKTFGEVCKFTSTMYAKLTDNEKDQWTRKAQDDKSRYIVELASYIPPDGYDARGDAMIGTGATAAAAAASSPDAKKHAKTDRDPNAPRRNCSAFVMYTAYKMKELKQQHADLPTTNLCKVISESYKSLSDQDRAAWEARAMQDKVRYDTEAARYDPVEARDTRGVLLADMKGKKRSKKEKRDPDAPKRASGAYVFFTNEIRGVVMKEKPGLKFVEMGRELGGRWRALDPESRKKYEKMALDDKVRFQQEMEAYNAGLPRPSSSATTPGSEEASQTDESQVDADEDGKPPAASKSAQKGNPLHSFGPDAEDEESTASEAEVIMPPPASAKQSE